MKLKIEQNFEWKKDWREDWYLVPEGCDIEFWMAEIKNKNQLFHCAIYKNFTDENAFKLGTCKTVEEAKQKVEKYLCK